jgi:hypothetical protein
MYTVEDLSLKKPMRSVATKTTLNYGFVFKKREAAILKYEKWGFYDLHLGVQG